MLNYMKAELYRNFNRAHIWVFSGVIAALALLLNILIKFNASAGFSLDHLFEMITQILILPIFLAATFIDTTTAEEQKNLTLKNAVSFGTPRSKIVLSKVIVTVILSIIATAIILTVFVGSGLILFGIGEGSGQIIGNASIRILTSLPLLIGAISIGTFIALIINNSTVAAFVYVGVFTTVSGILNLLTMLVSDKFSYISKYLITSQLINLKVSNLAIEDLFKAAGIGIAYTILFIALSMLYIKRKEIR